MFIIQGKVGNSIFVILYLCILCAKVMSANIPSDDGSQKPLLIRLIDLASSDSNHVPKEKNQSTSSEFKVDESQKDELSAEVDGSADPNEYKSGNWVIILIFLLFFALQSIIFSCCFSAKPS